MATTLTSISQLPQRNDAERGHKMRLTAGILAAVGLTAVLAVYGFGYYCLDLASRAESAQHRILRPSGSVGLRLGILGLVLFGVLFLYPIRKHWKWLASIGKTRHWLDFHALVGMTAPVIITFHSSFKLSGLAGTAYWIMIAVALSGFVGRYLYAQIPRSLNSAQLTFAELETQAAELTQALHHQDLIREDEVAPLLQMPSPEQVRSMALLALFWHILRLDLTRPLLVSRLRRRALTGAEIITTLGGVLASKHEELEAVIASVRRQSWLRAKMAFMQRVQEAFHLWHVIHRPFSYSFVILVAIHIGVVLMMGYY